MLLNFNSTKKVVWVSTKLTFGKDNWYQWRLADFRARCMIVNVYFVLLNSIQERGLDRFGLNPIIGA